MKTDIKPHQKQNVLSLKRWIQHSYVYKYMCERCFLLCTTTFQGEQIYTLLSVLIASTITVWQPYDRIWYNNKNSSEKQCSSYVNLFYIQRCDRHFTSASFVCTITAWINAHELKWTNEKHVVNVLYIYSKSLIKLDFVSRLSAINSLFACDNSHNICYQIYLFIWWLSWRRLFVRFR